MKIEAEKIAKNLVVYLNTAKVEAKKFNIGATSAYLGDIKSLAYLTEDYYLALIVDYIIKTIDDLNYIELFEGAKKSEEIAHAKEHAEKLGEDFRNLLEMISPTIPKEMVEFIESLVKALEHIEEYINGKLEDRESILEALINLMKTADKLVMVHR
jgi:hypothetical protein